MLLFSALGDGNNNNNMQEELYNMVLLNSMQSKKSGETSSGSENTNSKLSPLLWLYLMNNNNNDMSGQEGNVQPVDLQEMSKLAVQENSDNTAQGKMDSHLEYLSNLAQALPPAYLSTLGNMAAQAGVKGGNNLNINGVNLPPFPPPMPHQIGNQPPIPPISSTRRNTPGTTHLYQYVYIYIYNMIYIESFMGENPYDNPYSASDREGVNPYLSEGNVNQNPIMRAPLPIKY